MNTSNYYLQLKENIQSLTLATINLDKKYEEKFKKLSDSIDIEEAQEILIEIKQDIETTTKQLKELETIIKNYTNVPTDIENLKDKDSDLQKQINDNTSDILDNKLLIGNNTSSINSIKNDDIKSINETIYIINQNLATAEANIINLRKTVNENSANIESLQTNVNNNSADIESLQNDMKSKADTDDVTDIKNSVDGINQRLVTAEGNIENLQNDMNSKAETDDVYTKTQIDGLLGGFYKIYKSTVIDEFTLNTTNLRMFPYISSILCRSEQPMENITDFYDKNVIYNINGEINFTFISPESSRVVSNIKSLYLDFGYTKIPLIFSISDTNNITSDNVNLIISQTVINPDLSNRSFNIMYYSTTESENCVCRCYITIQRNSLYL